jgi:DNA-binding winged helix-turn-helix (wHTH) protein
LREESLAIIRFPPFVLDPAAGTLLRDAEVVHLRPRTWDVLCHLAERPGLLVTKDELLDAVWSDAVVTEGTLTNSIRELRAALGDDARSPRLIETVHRRGFRFVADVGSSSRDDVRVHSGQSDDGRAAEPRAARRDAGVRVVGRTVELDALARLAAEAAAGATRVALVRGEAGIGKSSVVDRLVGAIAARADLHGMRAAVGRAIGYLQGAPPYLPVVSAIEQLATGDGGVAVVEALRAHAPDLLQQMPWLAPGSQQAPATAAAPHERDLAARLSDFLAAVTERFPVAIVLEDGHDADAPTIDFAASLLEAPRVKRLLVVVTYRPGEAVLAQNGLAPAAARIEAMDGGSAINLELLGRAEVAEYLHARDAAFWTDEMVASVHRRSGGNPLFMVTVADTVELVGGEVTDGDAVPDSLRGLLDTQLRSLHFAQCETLIAASVAGVEFSSLAVAAATGRTVDEVEDTCEELSRQARFVRTTGVADWPSGAVGQAYSFRHDLYRQALYATLPPARRRALHQRIGEALEKGHAGATVEVAAELADHFARSLDHDRAIKYLREAAQVARMRFANREAIDLLDRGFALLAQQPEDAARDQIEFGLEMDRAAAAAALHGWGSAVAGAATAKVGTLGERLPPSRERFLSLAMVFGYHIIRSDVPAATRVAEHLTRAAKESDWSIAPIGATGANAIVAYTRGEFELAERSARVMRAGWPSDVRLPFRDALIAVKTALAQTLCYLDRRAEAESVGRDAIEHADRLEDPYEMAHTRMSAAYCAALFDDRAVTRHLAADAATFSRQHGIEPFALIAEILAAWADVDGAAATRRQSLVRAIDELDKTGHLNGKGAFLALLAEVEIEAGDLAAAADSLAAARTFCETTGSHCHLAEIYRRTAWVEQRLGGSSTARGPRARARLEEAERIARGQGCHLVLRRLGATS